MATSTWHSAVSSSLVLKCSVRKLQVLLGDFLVQAKLGKLALGAAVDYQADVEVWTGPNGPSDLIHTFNLTYLEGLLQR